MNRSENGASEVGGGKAVQEWATELVTTGGSWASTLPGSFEELCALFRTVLGTKKEEQLSKQLSEVRDPRPGRYNTKAQINLSSNPRV